MNNYFLYNLPFKISCRLHIYQTSFSRSSCKNDTVQIRVVPPVYRFFYPIKPECYRWSMRQSRIRHQPVQSLPVYQ